MVFTDKSAGLKSAGLNVIFPQIGNKTRGINQHVFFLDISDDRRRVECCLSIVPEVNSMGAAVVMEAVKQKTTNIIGLIPCDVFHNVESKVTDDFIVGARKFYGSAFKNKGWEEAFLSYVDWRNNQLLNCIKEMKVPIVCINSDRYKNEVEIARKYTSSFDIMIIEGVGHAVMTEAPEEFNRLLEEIIKQFVHCAA